MVADDENTRRLLMHAATAAMRRNALFASADRAEDSIFARLGPFWQLFHDRSVELFV
jgi:hypothetical protein